MEEQYSCDEDDWDAEEEKKSLLSSRSTVSSRGGRLSLKGGQDKSSMAGGGAGIYFSDDEDATEFVTDQRARSLKGDVSPRRVSGDSLVRELSAGCETSSQVARSILGGIFTSLPPLSDEASEDVQELEFSQPGDEEHLDDGDPDEEEDPRVEVAKRMEELDQVHKSFSERMTDWINSVSIKQKEMEEEEENRCESGVQGASKGREGALSDDRVSSRSDLDNKTGRSDDLRDDMPSRPGSTGVWDKESTLDDTCTKSSDSQKNIESEKGNIGDGGNSKYIEVENTDETMSQNYEEDLRNKFHGDRSQRGIAFSMIPSLAFSSYEEGFAKAQMTNGRQLYDNGLIRQRGVGSRVRSLPFPEAPAQYRKVVETMEQRMVVEADGTQVVDTKHRREEEQSNGRDKGWPWCASVVFALGSFGFLLLCLLLVFVFLPNQHSEELRRCLLKDTQVLGQEADIIESI